MVRRTPKGYEVTSESGKRLSRKTMSKGEAVARLRQIEWFKSHPKKR